LNDLTPQQERLMSVEKWLFRGFVLTFVLLGCVTLYFGERSPTHLDAGSGRVNPFFDKVHGNYVYVTDLENDSLRLVFYAAVVCFLVLMLIHFKLKSTVTRSAPDGKQSESPDHGNGHE
jgi:hypothetical protein